MILVSQLLVLVVVLQLPQLARQPDRPVSRPPGTPQPGAPSTAARPGRTGRPRKPLPVWLFGLAYAPLAYWSVRQHQQARAERLKMLEDEELNETSYSDACPGRHRMAREHSAAGTLLRRPD